MKANIKSTYRIIRENWKRLILLELLYKLIFLFLLVPLTSLGFNLALDSTRYSYITTENIFKFISYPQTICVIIIVVFLIALFLQMETASLFFFFEDCKNHVKHNIGQLLIAGVRSMCSMLRRKCFLVPVYTLCMSIFLNIPMIVIVITEQGIPLYLMKSFLSMDYAKGILAIVLLFLLIISYRRIFVLPICILDKKGYHEAKKISLTYMKGFHNLMIFQLVGINILLVVFYIIVYAICFGILVVGINLFVDSKVAIPLFLQNYEQLNHIIFICVSIFATIINYAMISNFYVRASKPKIKEIVEGYDVKAHRKKMKLQDHIRKQLKRVCVVIACLCAVTTYSYFYNMLRNGSFAAEEALLGMQITAHRGDSKEAPENTLPAIQSAIDSFADYAEIDVQLTADGVVVLCHDSTLYRTGGARVRIADLTYGELLAYDVGGWFSEEYIGTSISTLEEVLILSKGKINLNIELKRISKQQELVDKVVELINEYEFERQCVITSMSYEALKMVKEADSTIKTGYIMSLAYGNFYENSNIDFFSMKASIVTEDIVKKAHTLGKEVHVWTVNSKNEVTRLSALGVDNIITDVPVYVQTVLYDVEDTSLLQYVKMIMK